MKQTIAWTALACALGCILACDSLGSKSESDQNEPGDGDGTGGTLGDGDGDGDGDGGDNGDGDGDGDGTGGSSKEEAQKGERGSSCNSTADCIDGLSCIVTNDCPQGVSCSNKSCQPSNFDIIGTGRQCHISECTSKDDCCGDLPQQRPEKCIGREKKCTSSSLPGCATTTCTDDDECGEGRCAGRCTYDTAARCVDDSECEPDTCIINDVDDPSLNYCQVTSVTGCSSDDDCYENVCSLTTTYCDCVNPEYDPTDPICTDEDCEGICEYACANELCVLDSSCDVDDDCSSLTPFCTNEQCVECRDSEDCEDEECVAGRCGPECEYDTECGLFELCVEGGCQYVGCQSDRECVLAGHGAAQGQDPRLSVCDLQGGVGTCVFPCEIDAQCATTELCFEGKCQYIGCETDAECKTIAGLHNQPPPSKERPWRATAICQEEPNNP